MHSALKDFYLNEVMRNEVKNYLIESLKEEGTRRIFSDESTVGFPQAMGVINKAFEDLEILFASKSEGKELKNEAR